MRATQTTTYRSLQSFLDRTSDRLANLQLQAATGKRVNRPSDDPTAISPVLSARTQIQSSDRYIETIESGLDRIDGADGYLDGIENTLVRLKEIGIATVNSSLSPQDMLTYADEVAQLRESLLDVGNAQIDGKYLFAGFSEKTAPFALNPNYQLPVTDPLYESNPVNYQGDYGELEFEIAPNELIGVNLTGNSLFLGDRDNDGVTDAGAVDIFALATRLEEALRANNQPTGLLMVGPTATETTAGAAAVAEYQTMDFTAVTVANGETLDFTMNGETIQYSNSSGGDLSAAALVADIATTLTTATATGAEGDYTFAINGGAATTLDITQASGNAHSIADITTVNLTAVNGEPTGVEVDDGVPPAAEVQSLDFSSTTVADGESLTLTVAGTDFTYTNSSGAPLTNTGLAAAVAADLAVANYTLTDAGSGALTITQNAGSESDIALVTTTNSAGPTVQALLGPLETAANQVRSQRSLKGNVGHRLEIAREHMEQIRIDMEEFRSRFEDADILKTITDMQQQEQSFEAALSITGRVSQLSILDYI